MEAFDPNGLNIVNVTNNGPGFRAGREFVSKPVEKIVCYKEKKKRERDD